MATTSHYPQAAHEPAQRVRHDRRGLSRWGWLAVGAVALIVNVALVSAIVAGRGANTAPGSATATGASARSPLDAVGTLLAESPCISSRMIWTSDVRVACGTWSATVAPDSTIAAVSIYAAGREGYQQYAGTLPLALHWGDTITEVAAELGAPRVIYTAYGSPRLVYPIKGQAYRAIELQFDTHDTLVEISATLTD